MSDSKAVPKFGSFRPKTTVPIDQKETPTGSKEKERTGGKGHRSHHHRRPRSKSGERHGQSFEAEVSHVPRPVREKSPEIFFIDRKGDEKNLVYGSIHRYSVPEFYRVGAGRVLGAPSRLKIDRNNGEDKGIILHDWKDSKFGHREKYVFSRVERERPRLLKVRPEIATQNPEDLSVSVDFIPLNPVKGKKRKRSGTDRHDDFSSENDDTHYRSIHGKSKGQKEPIDEALQYVSKSESSGSEAGIKLGHDDSARRKNIDLSRRVEQFPQDIDAWLALIEHQGGLLRGQDDRRRLTNAEIRSTAEIKIHIYEKALDKVTHLRGRERLLLGLMKEGSKIWETKAQSDRWEQISKDNIDSLKLWKSFVDFRQTTFSTFTYEDTRDVFISRIKLLSDAARSAGIETINSLYQQLLYVLLRLTTFMRESGYSELAVAIWQGLLEVNFRAPSQAFSQEEIKHLFSNFWESEVARFGDDGALGWRHFLENQNVSEVDASIAEADNTLDDTNLFQSWAANERSRCKDSVLPARTMDDVVEDDPYRVILFTDIEEFLITFPPGAVELLKSLIDAFLLFCRLPPVDSFSQDTLQYTDAFVRNELLECGSSWISGVYAKKLTGEGDVINIASALEVPLPNHQGSPSTMFASNLWFKSVAAWRDRYPGDTSPVAYNWVRNVLKQVIKAHFREDLAEYYLAFEWRNEPESIKKISKSLLKQHPSSLKLYNAYAMIESSRGNNEVANGVFSAALNMSKSMPEKVKMDCILLWRSWVWVHLDGLDKSSALQRLLSIADITVDISNDASPMSLLKTKQHLVSNRDYLLSTGNNQHAIIYGECLATFEYLTSESTQETQSNAQGNITSALASFKALSKLLIDRKLGQSAPHELLLQSASRLLFHHARIGPFRPALLREQLAIFITLFPQNTIFLSLYAWNESRLRIDNRVRNILLSTVLTPENDTLTSRLFGINYEINQGTKHSVRSAFEHAVNSPASSSSAGLWKFYILYALQQFRPQAKDVWYRALRACPWAKELYIIGFEKMGDLVDFAEMKGTWKVMGEKELRVHVDLEDSFEDIAELDKRCRIAGYIK